MKQNTIESSINYYDRVYEKSFPYTRNTLKNPMLHHIANEKSIVNLYTHYSSNKTIQHSLCSSIL